MFSFIVLKIFSPKSSGLWFLFANYFLSFIAVVHDTLFSIIFLNGLLMVWSVIHFGGSLFYLSVTLLNSLLVNSLSIDCWIFSVNITTLTSFSWFIALVRTSNTVLNSIIDREHFLSRSWSWRECEYLFHYP